jgi:hypothetical protein
MKKIVEKYINLNYGMSLNDILQTVNGLPNHISYDDIRLQYDHDDEYVWLKYEREETDKEYEARLFLEERRKELDKNRDLNQLRYLISVYGIPDEQ